MRRFAWTLVIIIIVGMTVFLVGWVQLRVEPGQYAVVVSKIGGIDERVVNPGDFRWSAGLLLPTNVRLIKLSLHTVERRIDLSGEMPSASAYKAFMAGEPDFSWALSVRIVAAPKPEALPAIVEKWGVKDDESLAVWLTAEMDSAVAGMDAVMAARDGRPSDGSALAKALEEKWPDLDIRSVAILNSRFPDMKLYEEARALYAAYLESYRANVEPALTRASVKAASDQVRIDTLERYGELLARYPNLIDYLAIEAGIAPRAVVTPPIAAKATEP